MVEVRPVDAPCGAVITGVDLSLKLSEKTVTNIREAWLQYHVLVFPEQVLNSGDLERFTLSFGDFGEDPFFDPIKEHNHIAAIRRDANEKTSLFC